MIFTSQCKTGRNGKHFLVKVPAGTLVHQVNEDGQKGELVADLTRDGEELAIKVQYPGVAKSIDSDVDNVMTLLKLSGFAQVQLVARISRSGNATAGEWVGRSQPLASSTTELQQLTIDTADGQAQ